MNESKETVLVTGSSGLIGSSVARRLREHYRVVGMGRHHPMDPEAVDEYIYNDFASATSIEETLKTVRERYGDRFTSVVHLAAHYSFDGEPSPLYQKVNVEGLRTLLHELKSFHVGQFIFASTMLVHMPGKGITEDSPIGPKWEYPQSKLDGERMVLAEHGDIPVAILRIATTYDEWSHSIPLTRQIQRIYERQLMAMVFPGDKNHRITFIHLDDLTDAIDRIIQKRNELPKELTLILSEPESYSYDSLQRAFSRYIHGTEFVTQEIPKSLGRTGSWFLNALNDGCEGLNVNLKKNLDSSWIPDVVAKIAGKALDQVPCEEPFIKPWMMDIADDTYDLDPSRAEQILGWKAKRTLAATIPEIVENLKRDPVRWYKENKLSDEEE